MLTLQISICLRLKSSSLFINQFEILIHVMYGQVEVSNSSSKTEEKQELKKQTIFIINSHLTFNWYKDTYTQTAPS